MNRINWPLVVTAIIILCAACGKPQADNNNKTDSDSTAASIIGRWDISKEKDVYTKDGVVFDQSTIEYAPGSGIFEFSPDGTFAIYDGNVEKGTYRKTGNLLDITYDDSGLSVTYDIETLSSSVLIIVSERNVDEYHIRRRLEFNRL